MTGTVTLTLDGRVGRITLDHPARHNAMSLEMWRLLRAQVAAASADPEIRAIVVSGAGGRAFCSGADISEFGRNRADAASAAIYDEAVHRAVETLLAAPKPTIAAIEGICFGGGLEIALCCDLRIASTAARFRLPAARLGIGYAYSNVELMVDRLGASAAAEILFTAAILDATEGLSSGIVQRVFAEGSFAADSAAYVAGITANAPLVLTSLKRCLVELAKPAGQRDLDAAARAVAACTASEDYQEGRAAFRERREPLFSGR